MHPSSAIGRRAPSSTAEATIEWVCDPDALLDRAAEWDALALAHPDPFAGTDWLVAWWRAFGGDRAAVLTARRGGALVGGLPVLRAGRRLTAMVNDHTPLFRPVAADDEALSTLVRAALRAAPLGLRLASVPQEDPVVALARSVAVRCARVAHVAPIVETTGPFAEWRADSKKRWGAPLERFRRKMAREHDMRVVVNVPPPDLEGELARGFAVEASGWKGRAGTAIVSRADTERFYRGVAAAFHARGELVCSSIVLDGRLVAWDLSLLHADRVFLLKTGFDEGFRRLAPGLVLRLSVIEDCFARGLHAHELLGSVDDWKPKFATTGRPHVTLDLFGRSAPGAVGAARFLAERATTRVAHRLARGRAA